MDYDSPLPVRTEADVDDRLQARIIDGSDVTKKATVDSDSNLHVEVHGNNPAAGDETMRMSELGHTAIDGIYDGSNNTDPSNMAVIAHVRAATPADTDQTKRVTAVTSGTAHCLDISLHDESGVAYSSSNPMPVSVEDSEGDEIHNYDTSASLAADAASNHDYTVTAGKTLKLHKVLVGASGRAKWELRVANDGVTFSTKAVRFTSASDNNTDFDLKIAISIPAAGKVRVIRTNRDNQAQDVYSTIIGVEV